MWSQGPTCYVQALNCDEEADELKAGVSRGTSLDRRESKTDASILRKSLTLGKHVFIHRGFSIAVFAEAAGS